MPVDVYMIAIIGRICYARALVPLKTCIVTFTDLEGSRHSVEVMADSLFEAAALALRAMAQAEFIEPNPGAASQLEIQVRPPLVSHSVTVGQVRRWIESGSSDPRVAIKKARLAEMLAAK
jgi:hypothetical protein